MTKRFWQKWGCKPPPDHFNVTCHPDRLDEPLHWRKPSRVFVCSMGDLFHDDVPGDFIDMVFAVMAACPQHTFQVLTKRPERMLEMMDHEDVLCDICSALSELASRQLISDEYYEELDEKLRGFDSSYYPLPNVHLGVTCEDQTRADERIPLLLQCPAAVRFVSCEPLLGPVDLEIGYGQGVGDLVLDTTLHCSHLDWVICGGETGPGARPMHPEWAQSLRDQCKAAGVAYFFKQWGAWCPQSQLNLEPEFDREPGDFYLKTTDELYTLRESRGRNQRDAGVLTYDKHPLPRHEFGDGTFTHRVGKKHAGRLLDGVEYSEYPEVGV